MVGYFKSLMLIAATLPGAAAQGLMSVVPTDLRATCTTARRFVMDSAVYGTQTRVSLMDLGRQGDPVGLYYLAHLDLEAGFQTEAILKLERAARLGLGDAYAKLADIYAARRDRVAARTARLCADSLSVKRG